MVNERYSQTEAILLRVLKSGERSNSLCFLTEKEGLIWTQMKPQSGHISSAGFANIPSRFRINIYRTTRNRLYVRETVETNPYRRVHEDFAKLKACWHVLSPLIKLVQPGPSDEFLFRLADRAFNAICGSDSEISALLFIPPYYVTLIKHFGYGFPLEICKKCGSRNVSRISPSSGGLICPSCSSKITDSKTIDPFLLKKTMTAANRKSLADKSEKKTIVALIKNLELYLFKQFSQNSPDIDL
ncbi:DNA repair protein RecO C-terminal domain-containing protein [candidate division WOR-3 bacterium]|nr:DNA repair protein RecO C-terminal domain-containing protein [candidate division WOR-3 bacterium]